jgi:hypothetical protein
MNKFLKLKNNILSLRPISVLGWGVYSRYLLTILFHIRQIIGSGDLRPLDKAIGKYAQKFHYQHNTFTFDCQFCDEHLNEDSFAFGIVREIYIRNCYFKWLPLPVYHNARTVLDLGTNRGAFSSLITTQAQLIICVECGEQYVPIINHNLQSNHFTNYKIEVAFMGQHDDSTSSAPVLTVDDLLQRYQIQSVDLMKIDIEGAEFALFEACKWLRKVQAITMEVHPQHGNPQQILDQIAQYEFAYVIADENLKIVTNPKQASFIYAYKSK